MTQHIFLICESCQLASANKEESEPAGTLLLKELQALHQNWSRKSEFEIRGVGCLSGALYYVIGLTGILVIDIATFFVAVSTIWIVQLPQPTKSQVDSPRSRSRFGFPK